MNNLALQANVCYNTRVNIVGSGDVSSISRLVTHLIRRCITMDTLSPHADNGNIPVVPGIYKITCTANKKIYVGSALSLRNRQVQHFNALRRNQHENPKLQRAWNKYGLDVFTYEVLEIVLLPELLTAREQYWFNKLNPFGRKGFNIYRIAGSALGRRHTPLAREKMRLGHLGITYTPETREKDRQASLGRKHTPKTREKQRQAKLGNTYNRGRKHTPEAIKNMSGKKMAPSAVEKTRQANLGSKRTPEAREKMRLAKLGKKQSPESNERRRQALLGKKRSPEIVENVKQARWGKRDVT